MDLVSRSHGLWLFVVLVGAALVGGYHHYRVPTRGPVLNIRGVELGMTSDQVVGLLGPGTRSSGWTSYYFGLLSVAQEHLGVNYDPGQHVCAIDGEQLLRGSNVVMACGDTFAHVSTVLGSPRSKARTGGTAVGYNFDGVVVYLDHDQVLDIVLETAQYQAQRLKQEAKNQPVPRCR